MYKNNHEFSITTVRSFATIVWYETRMSGLWAPHFCGGPDSPVQLNILKMPKSAPSRNKRLTTELTACILVRGHTDTHKH